MAKNMHQLAESSPVAREAKRLRGYPEFFESLR